MKSCHFFLNVIILCGSNTNNLCFKRLMTENNLSDIFEIHFESSKANWIQFITRETVWIVCAFMPKPVTSVVYTQKM